jgi:hypothetical protein
MRGGAIILTDAITPPSKRSSGVERLGAFLARRQREERMCVASDR